MVRSGEVWSGETPNGLVWSVEVRSGKAGAATFVKAGFSTVSPGMGLSGKAGEAGRDPVATGGLRLGNGMTRQARRGPVRWRRACSGVVRQERLGAAC